MISLDHISEPHRVMAPTFWYGGKGRLVHKILPFLPDGRIYCEPYCGMASVFWHKKPHRVEVLNDAYGLLVNFFRCMQDKATFEELQHRIIWTPYSRSEFVKAIEVMADPDASDIDKAWAFYVGHNQGYAGKCDGAYNWGRVFLDKKGMAHIANVWRGRMKRLEWWHDRLTRVQIDNICALQCIEYWDNKDTVFYVDPPYLMETRSPGKQYRHETDMSHHEALIDLLCGIKGQAVLSCYDHPVYNPLLEHGYKKHQSKTVSYTGGKNRGQKVRGPGSGVEHMSRIETMYILDRSSIKQLSMEF